MGTRAVHEKQTSGPIKIGTTLPLTGSLRAFGTSLLDGYKQAIDEVNNAGGLEVGGTRHEVNLVVQDNASDGDKASSDARDLVLNHGVIALLGPATPPLSIPVSSVGEQLQVPTLITITPVEAWEGGNSDGWKWSWDVFFDEKQMTTTQFRTADLVPTNKKVALFTDTEQDGITMGSLWTFTAPEFGYEIVYHAQFPVGNTNFSSQVAEAKAADAEIVIAQIVPPDGVTLLREMKAQAYDPPLIFLEKAGDTGGYPELAGGVLAANWFAEGMGLPQEQSFIDKYKAQLGGVNSSLGTIVCGYTIARILLESIRKAGSTDASAVNAAIGEASGTYPAGTVTFNSSHAAILPAVQTQWQGSDMVLVLNADGTAANAVLTKIRA